MNASALADLVVEHVRTIKALQREVEEAERKQGRWKDLCHRMLDHFETLNDSTAKPTGPAPDMFLDD
jgi:hypothetical protein